MEVDAAAIDGDALLLLQAWSTGVIATSKNSFAVLTDSILCAENADVLTVISGTVYRLLLSLAFAAALQEELKASTSFLHLL